MVGQNRIKEWVSKTKHNFPHFIVLIGERGIGKRTLCRYIANEISCVYSECEIRTEAVREVIDTAYKSTTKVMYCFPDSDVMKAQAKNAMLKITEEPPENAYFCLTLSDDKSLLETIASRAFVIHLDGYTEDELMEYYIPRGNNKELGELYCSIGTTPGDIGLLIQYGKEFYDYVKLVFDNIVDVEPANAFKSSNKLALKGENGYDLGLFWKVYLHLCVEQINGDAYNDTCKLYAEAMITTCDSLNKLTNPNVNKQQLYDMWILDIRSVFLL